jgi:hypothetical protein
LFDAWNKLSTGFDANGEVDAVFDGGWAWAGATCQESGGVFFSLVTYDQVELGLS